MDDSTFLIALGLLGAVSFVWAVERFLGPIAVAVKNPAQSATRDLALLFHERVQSFNNHLRTLDEHSNEYRAVFSGAEWNSLTNTLSRLNALDKEIQSHVAAENYPVAEEVLKKLYNTSDNQNISHDDPNNSAPWEESVYFLLKRVVQNLESATQETNRLHQPGASRKRRPTLVTLADVKKSLLEDGIIRREDRNRQQS